MKEEEDDGPPVIRFSHSVCTRVSLGRGGSDGDGGSGGGGDGGAPKLRTGEEGIRKKSGCKLRMVEEAK